MAASSPHPLAVSHLIKPGGIGLIVAKAGVGKTACLVQIARAELAIGQRVLHMSLEHSVLELRAWYEALGSARGNSDPRWLISYRDQDLWPERFERALENFRLCYGGSPQTVLIDGYPWHKHGPAHNQALLATLSRMTAGLGIRLWMSGITHADASRLPADYQDLPGIEAHLLLEPVGGAVTVRTLSSGAGQPTASLPSVLLSIDTLGPIDDPSRHRVVRLPSSAYTLLSGGPRARNMNLVGVPKRGA